MAQKKNKERKEKLNKFKNQHKKNKNIMSTEMPQIRPFRQVPVFEPDAKFEVTGEEFQFLQGFIQQFVRPVHAIETIFKRAIENGAVKIKNVDQEGNEIPQAEIDEYVEKLKAYYQNLTPEQANEQAPVVETEQVVAEPKAPRKLKKVD